MPYATFTTPVNAKLETVWKLLLDKAENPQRYIPFALEDVQILEKFDDGMLRRMGTSQVRITERIRVDQAKKEVTFTLIDHPVFTGQIINKVAPSSNNTPEALPLLTYTVDLQTRGEEAERNHPADAQWFNTAAEPEMIQKAVLHMKDLAEQESAQLS